MYVYMFLCIHICIIVFMYVCTVCMNEYSYVCMYVLLGRFFRKKVTRR